MIYVVGSGPAGVACAVALVRMGLQVTMLDAGLTLEPERAAVLEKLGKEQPEDWDPSSIRTLKEKVSTNVQGGERKYLYGSDFPYRETAPFIPTESHGVNMVPSLAKGGLSNIWGGAVLPYISSDIADWPISVSDLAPYYRSVLSFLDLAAARDDLEAIFPLYSEDCHPLQPSQQAQRLMRNLLENREQLHDEGIFFGYSRLAVRADFKENKPGCVYCGMCLYGCPYCLIYSSSFTLEELKTHPNFQYIRDVVVEKVVESQDTVTLYAQSRQTREEIAFRGSRAYLACGALSTTKILLESLGAYDQTVILKDSQYFLLPLVRFAGVHRVSQERLYTLAQIFLEVQDRRLCQKTIHLQVYTYSDLFREAIKSMIGPLTSLLDLPVQQLLGRILLIQGFIPSDISPSISIQLRHGVRGQPNYLVLDPVSGPNSKQTVTRLVGKLFKNRSLLKGIPAFPWLIRMRPGSSFHYGGTFPMKRTPRAFESDLLGRPHGFEKVHIVDPTIFPSIPGTTIVLSIMANAYRIASSYHET